jgi:hypothetical protein
MNRIISKVIHAVRKLAVKKKRKRPFQRVIQVHHISYDPVWTVRVYKGEHWIISMLLRRTHVSSGFITVLKKWLMEHEQRAMDLGGEENHTKEK